jgi:hypothetical protein
LLQFAEIALLPVFENVETKKPREFSQRLSSRKAARPEARSSSNAERLTVTSGLPSTTPLGFHRDSVENPAADASVEFPMHFVKRGAGPGLRMAAPVMRAWDRAAIPKTTYGNSDDAHDQHGLPPTFENPCFPAKIARSAASKKEAPAGHAGAGSQPDEPHRLKC